VSGSIARPSYVSHDLSPLLDLRKLVSLQNQTIFKIWEGGRELCHKKSGPGPVVPTQIAPVLRLSARNSSAG